MSLIIPFNHIVSPDHWHPAWLWRCFRLHLVFRLRAKPRVLEFDALPEIALGPMQVRSTEYLRLHYANPNRLLTEGSKELDF